MTDWFRSWRGAPTDNKWLVIGRKAGVPPGMVSAVFWALCDHASQHEDRGRVGDFDVEVYAAFSGFEDRDIAAVIAALADKGVIAAGRLTGWERRQPKREDETSTERSRASRERKATKSASPATGDAVQRTATQRNDREEKKRAETDTEAEQTTPPLPPDGQEFGVVVDPLLAMADQLIRRNAPDFAAVNPLLSAEWLRLAVADAGRAHAVRPGELSQHDIGEALDAALGAIDRAMQIRDGPYVVRYPERFSAGRVADAFGARLGDVREQRRPTATSPPRSPVPSQVTASPRPGVGRTNKQASARSSAR